MRAMRVELTLQKKLPPEDSASAISPRPLNFYFMLLDNFVKNFLDDIYITVNFNILSLKAPFFDNSHDKFDFYLTYSSNNVIIKLLEYIKKWGIRLCQKRWQLTQALHH